MTCWEKLAINSDFFDWNFEVLTPSMAQGRIDDELMVDFGATPLTRLPELTEHQKGSFPTQVNQNTASIGRQSPYSCGSASGNVVSPQSHSSYGTESSLTRQMARRTGRLHLTTDDGQLRYFGATSNRQLFPNGIQSLFQDSMRSVRTHGDEALSNAQLTWNRDEAYEAHLTNLFFTWHQPVLQEVDKKIYFRERERYNSGIDTPFYSPALENAM
jgi:hypothetical protein